MQVFNLARHVTRGATLATQRRDILNRWHRARSHGLTAQAAAEAVGVSRATLYRWQTRTVPHSCRPRRLRQPTWPCELVGAVRETRADHPMWGKAEIAILLQREGWTVSESMVGRILKRLVDQSAVTLVPTLRRAPCRPVHPAPCQAFVQGTQALAPGEIVQLNTLTISPLAEEPQPTTLTITQPTNPGHLICPERGHLIDAPDARPRGRTVSRVRYGIHKGGYV